MRVFFQKENTLSELFVTPYYKDILKNNEIVDEYDQLKYTLDRDIKEYDNFLITDNLNLPKNYIYAYHLVGNQFVLSFLNRVVNRFLFLVRTERDKKLEDLDKQYLAAMARNLTNEMSEIENQRQLLRDLPDTIIISNVTKPEDCERLWPSLLGPITEFVLTNLRMG
jgi:hypothetical protein